MTCLLGAGSTRYQLLCVLKVGFVVGFFFFFPCDVEVASSKGTFNSVRIEGTPLLPGLIFPQGLFSEESVFQVLTDPISAFLYICWLVHYDLACNLCNGSKASWI